MEQYRKIERPRQGQAEEEQVWRIEHRRFETAEEGLTSVGKWIPEREMSVAQAVGKVRSRRNELRDHVVVDAAGREQGIRGQNQHQDEGCHRQGCRHERGNSAGALVKNHECAMVEDVRDMPGLHRQSQVCKGSVRTGEYRI